jgi:hypothetical protein
MLEEIKAVLRRGGVEPNWTKNGTPLCESSCSSYDGQVCKLTGDAPCKYCSIAISGMAEAIETKSSATSEVQEIVQPVAKLLISALWVWVFKGFAEQMLKTDADAGNAAIISAASALTRAAFDGADKYVESERAEDEQTD